MSRNVKIFLSAALLAVCASQAEAAGIVGKITGMLSGEVIALALSALLAVGAGFLGVVFNRIARTFKESGEFLTVLGGALEDSRITREELAGIVKEGKDIFTVWK
jgi:hypothetical protein